jgi:hypothetical protein
MGLFDCKASKAKDSEIAHLLVELTRVHEHLDKTNARLVEITAPGANVRAVPPPRTSRVELQELIAQKEKAKGLRQDPPVPTLPGYERPEPADRYEVT